MCEVKTLFCFNQNYFIKFANMSKTENRGGKRIGAGRKKIDNPKQQLFIYITTSDIEAIGSKEKVKDIAEKAVIRAAIKANKDIIK